MLLETILSALIPVGIEGIKQVTTKWFGGVRATSVDEQIKLDSSEVEKIKALAELDKPSGRASQWVIDLRESARYLGALVTIAVGVGSLFMPDVTENIRELAMSAASIAFGFLFGSRVVFNMNKK
jgi:hypothetical protein